MAVVHHLLDEVSRDDQIADGFLVIARHVSDVVALGSVTS